MQKTTPAPALGDRGADLVGRRRLAPLERDPLDVEAVLLADRDPALAERAGGDDRDAVAGGAEVRGGGVHRARPGRGEEQHLGLGAEHVLEPREAALVHLAEVGAAVVHHRLGHRREHLGRHGRRAGREQVALLHGAPG